MDNSTDFLLDDSRQGAELSPQILRDLKTSAGWLVYIGALGFISSLILLGLTFFSFFQILGTGYRYPTSVYMGMLVSFSVLGLMLYISALLFQYGNGIQKYMDTGKHYELEEAFRKQKIYLIIIGLLSTLSIGSYVVLFLMNLG